MLHWILEKLGYNYFQREKILRVIWKVMAGIFVVAMTYGFYAMVLDIIK